MTIILCYTQTLDGRIATITGESRYISDEASLRLNQELRRDSDAILVGIGTVLADDPLLTCRIPGSTNPLRIILDSQLRTPLDGQLAFTASDVPTVLAHLNSAAEDRKAKLIEAGFELLELEGDEEGHPDSVELIFALLHRGITSLIVEGGSGILTSFLRRGLWSRLEVVSVGKLIGSGIEAFGDLGVRGIDDVIEPEFVSLEQYGREAIWKFRNGSPHEILGGRAIIRSPLGESAKDVPTLEKFASPGRFFNGDEGRCLYFTAPGEVCLRPWKQKTPSEDEVELRSRIMGISPGTERNIYLGRMPERADSENDFIQGEFEYPLAYGYINVLEDGDGGRYFAFLPHGERFLAPRNSLIPLDNHISDDAALFIPHLETALSIVHDSGAKLGDRVLISGAGVLGVLTARLLWEFCGAETAIFDPDEVKSRHFGAGLFSSDPHSPLFGGQFDRTIEVSGNPQALEFCMERTVDEGQVILASWYGNRSVSVNLGNDFHRRRLRLISSQVSRMAPDMGRLWNKQRRMDLVIGLLGRVELTDLLTHRYPLSRAADAYELLTSAESHGLIALLPWC